MDGLATMARPGQRPSLQNNGLSSVACASRIPQRRTRVWSTGRFAGRVLLMQKYLDPGSEQAMTTLDDVGRFTIAAGRLLERGGNERFKAYGLTISDVAPLARLVQLGPMTPTELLDSSLLLTSAPVASHSINRLVESGLATRRPHESDGRKAVVEATAEGRAMMGDLHRAIRDAQIEFFAPLTQDELTTLRALFLRCIEARDL